MGLRRWPRLPHLAATAWLTTVAYGTNSTEGTGLPESNRTTCPHSTWPFREGAYCCRMNMDHDGVAISYSSQTCYGNHFVSCPLGTMEGQCKDAPAAGVSAGFRTVSKGLLTSVGVAVGIVRSLREMH
eukprot:TRINITY_DN26695_c0_g1_i2.p1 TRINITY_DN26695_c0_g1~~TRINITY_DN26695_c0_g1_i2.p1  ORF type:complete len:147 (+),score=1.97 TRINITY_DN26695_c0_g1_i2:59-442(+)